jgi:hypothetical protein
VSTALAVAGVTAVLRGLLEAWLADQDANAALGGANAEVTATAPDLIELSGPNAVPRLNLFLHQVTLNQGWRNVDLPSTTGAGVRSTTPPLAINLHYLLTAYGPQPLQAEVLLGYGMQLLHDSAVVSRRSVDGLLPPTLSTSGLGAQIEQLRITPELMGTEEISKLWAALQAKYRPSVAYEVSVVLIQATRPGRAAPPVLSRGAIDTATGREGGIGVVANLLPSSPGITAVSPPNGQPGARIGETVEVEGHRLEGAARVIVLDNRQYGIHQETAALSGTSGTLVKFKVPAPLAVGTYALSVLITEAGGRIRMTNRLALTVVPDITTPFPIAVAVDPHGAATLTIACVPDVQPSQQASVILGDREIPAEPHPIPTLTLHFSIPDAALGDHLTRLRIDGVDSLVVDRSAVPPVFLDRVVKIS